MKVRQLPAIALISISTILTGCAGGAELLLVPLACKGIEHVSSTEEQKEAYEKMTPEQKAEEDKKKNILLKGCDKADDIFGMNKGIGGLL